MERVDIVSALKAAKAGIESAYPIRLVGLVGSAARGEAGPDSDVDILVEYRPGLSLFRLESVRSRLGNLLHRDVDMVFRDGLDPKTRDRMLSDLIPL